MNVENNQQEINKVSEFETEQQDDNVSNGQQQQQSDMVSQENDVTPKKSDQFLPSLNNSNFNIVDLRRRSMELIPAANTTTNYIANQLEKDSKSA